MNAEPVRAQIREALLKALQYFVYRDSRFSSVLVFGYSLVLGHYRNVKRMPVEWLDETKTGFIRTLAAGTPGYSYGPVVSGSQRVEPVLLPAVSLYRFEDAGVSALSSSVVLRDKIVIERVEGVELSRCDFSAGPVLMHGEKSALDEKQPEEYIAKGMFLAGNGSLNYYHWMIELLPKLQFLREEGGGYGDFPLLVSDAVKNTVSFGEALLLAGKERQVIYLDEKITYRVGELVYINTPNCLPFNLKQQADIRVADFLFRKSSINDLRRSLGADPDGLSPAGSGRIFLARRPGRRSYNQEEIFKVFEKYGFEKVFPEDLSLLRQLELFSNAEIIAGPSGAAWTNLIFCRKGAKCLCWMAAEYSGFSAFSNLAQIAGADLRYVVYPTAARSTAELYELNYRIDAVEIKRALDELLRAQR